MKKIAYYITAHGYGHGTRSCDIINALIEQISSHWNKDSNHWENGASAIPGAGKTFPIIVKTGLPRPFLASRLPLDRLTLIPDVFDVGLIQKDSIRVDLDASLNAIEKLYAQEEELINGEVEFIRRHDVGVVVADIPAIPLAAARHAGVPSVAVGNFGWDWIYSDFIRHDSRWQLYAEKFRQVYRQTDLLIRIPFAEEMAAFPRKVDVPLLTRPGNPQRKMISELTGADVTKQWVLISFTALDWDSDALENVARLSDEYEFFSIEPLEWPDSCIHCLKRNSFRFSDVVASMDVVLTKPGFGILSDCVANRKPIIYTDRKKFREYAVLVESIKRFLKNTFIPGVDLYAGNLAGPLQKIRTALPPPETIPLGGEKIAARKILDFLP